MEVLLLTFANDRERPLPTLAGEYDELDRILARRELRRDFISRTIAHATLDQIADAIKDYFDELTLFLFSGHAGRDHLHTESGQMRAEGIAQLLGRCKNLKVVILNGCSTYGQVEALHRAGVPLVIATSAPLNDDIATRFSIELFQALEKGESIKSAFDIAIAVAVSIKPLPLIDRTAGFLENHDSDEPFWGFALNPNKPDPSDWKLPLQNSFSQPTDFKVNEHLLEVLYDTFSATNPALSELAKKRKNLKNNFGDTRVAILKALPAPIGEHLRKLVAPDIDGADKIGLPRLSKLALTYESSMRFLANLMLAQLWENQISDPAGWTLPPVIRSKLKEVIDAEAGTGHFAVLQNLQDAVECHCPNPFIKELLTFRKDFLEDKENRNACLFLESLPRWVATLAPHEIPELCFRAEENIALFFSKLGFLGRYVLATVRNIDVQKYRSKRDVEYEHKLTKWHDAVGSCEPSTLIEPYLLDNRSVVLLLHENGTEKNSRNYPYLSLAPFIIDKNTYYSEAEADLNLVTLYLFIRRDIQSGKLLYMFVNKPEKGIFDLNAGKKNTEEEVKIYQLTQGQFEEFYSTIVHPPTLDAL